MPKAMFPKRHYNTPGHAHELTFSCYRRRNYFEDPEACRIFMEELGQLREAYNLRIWAYVLMPNHVHVLLWPVHPNYNIAEIQKTLNGRTGRRVARWLKEMQPHKYEERLKENGEEKVFRFWQRGGGFDRNLWNAMAIHNAIEYIEGNPVRLRLVRKADWPYSSAHARRGKGGLMPDDFKIPILMARAGR